MTVSSQVIRTYLGWATEAVDVPLKNGLRVQILPYMDDLPKARKYQFAAFIAADGLLVVWDDDPNHLIERAQGIESELMEIVWNQGNEKAEELNKEKRTTVAVEEIDEEDQLALSQHRPTHLMNTILVAFTIVIVTIMLGAGMRAIVSEVIVDKAYMRCVLLALIPVQIFFTLVRSNHAIFHVKLTFG